MDRLTPLISKFQTHVVPLAQNTRAFFEPKFNRIHIPKNAPIRNYLTLTATVGLISGVALAILRTFQYNFDKTGLKEYSITAALKDIAGCTVFPGAGFVWRSMFGISKTVSLSALEHAVITAQTSNTHVDWRIAGLSFAKATPEDIAKTRLLLKGHRTNLDHLPVDMLALFFPQALSEWVSRSKSGEPVEWANLGQFKLEVYRDNVIRGFDFRAAADAAILADSSLEDADPKKARAKDRLDDLALELEVLLEGLPQSNESKELRNLNAALKIVEERRAADETDIYNNKERVYKEWSLFFSKAQLKDLSKDHLEVTNLAGETVLRLIAAKNPEVLLEYFKAGKVDHDLHNPVGKPTLLAIVLASADLSKDQTRLLIDAILAGVPGEDENKVSVYIDISLPDILANLQDRVIAGGRKDLSTKPTEDQLELAEQAANLLEFLRQKKTVNSIEAPPIDLTNFSHLRAATLEYELTQSKEPNILEQCGDLENAPWLASEVQRISSSDPAYDFYVLETKLQKSLQNAEAVKDLSKEGLEAYHQEKKLRFARQAKQKLVELNIDADILQNFRNLPTAMITLNQHCATLNKQLQTFLTEDEPADLPALKSIADLDTESTDRLADLLNKGAWQQDKNIKAAFVKAFATNTKWNASIEANVQLVRTKFAVCKTELKLLDSNPHRSAYLLDAKYQIAKNINPQEQPDQAKKAWKELVDFIIASPAEVCKGLPDEFVTEMPVDQVASLFASGKHADAILTYKKDVIVTASAMEKQLKAYDPDQQRVISSALDFMLPKAKRKLSPTQAEEIFLNVVNHTPAERSVLTTRLQQTLEGLGTKGSPEVRKLVLDKHSEPLQFWNDRYNDTNDTVQKNAIAGTVADILQLLRDYSELDLTNVKCYCPELVKVWHDWTRKPQELIYEGNWNQLFPVLNRIKDKKERDAAIRTIELPDRFDKANISSEAFLQLFSIGVFKGKTRDDGKHNITNTIVNSPHLLASNAVIAALTAAANQPLWVQGTLQGTSAIQQLAVGNKWEQLSMILGGLAKPTLTTAAASIPLPEKLENITAGVLAGLLSHDVFKGKTTTDGKNIIRLIIDAVGDNVFELNDILKTWITDDAQIPLYLIKDAIGDEKAHRSPIQRLFEDFHIDLLSNVLLKIPANKLKEAVAAIGEIRTIMNPDLYQARLTRLLVIYEDMLQKGLQAEVPDQIKKILTLLEFSHENVAGKDFPKLHALLAPEAPETED